MAAPANPRRAPDPQKPVHQRPGGFEYRVGDKRDALGDFFIAQAEQGRLGEAELFQFLTASGTIFHMGFHLALLRVSQFLEVVIP